MDLVIASGNDGKIEEMRDILKGKFDNIYSMKQIGILSDIEENGQTLIENAFIKARFVKSFTNLAVLADDTGLMVDALNGKPGVYTARFAGINATHADNRKLLLEKLEGQENRNATFETVVVLLLPNGKEITASGQIHGKILERETGERGFGYDSLFYSFELQKSFAQASLQEKDKVSHRAKALENLLKQL